MATLDGSGCSSIVPPDEGLCEAPRGITVTSF